MPRRPLPHIPRGPRRFRASGPSATLLACPRISPEWELSALRALMKPQLKGAILHREAKQRWTRSAERALGRTSAALRERLGCELLIHRPDDGDFHFVANVPSAHSDQARAWAVAFSKALPELWLVAGRLFVKNGRFYRRQNGYKLSLVLASDVHLPRALRAALRGCL